jgi:uncharacterized protein YbjT (DUF2867 family)
MTTSSIAAVTGATGAQGVAIAQAFADAGWHVRGLSRRSGPSPMPPGIEPFATPDAASLESALSGVAVLAVTLPIDYRRGVREAWLGGMLEAAARAGVQRLVLNLASRPLPGLASPVSESLRVMEAMALSGPVPAVVLRPTIYMDNLLQDWAIGGVRRDGVLAYPVPAEIRLNWISHRSLGAAAVAAATNPDVPGRAFDIAGPAALTGPEVAELLARALGRKVSYAALPPAAFAQALNAAMGPPAGDDIGELYAHLPRVPEAMAKAPGNIALGLAPESFAEWIARHDLRG